jgi:transposase InsO family protein
MRFAFIRDNRIYYPIAVMCRVLEVSRSGYYAWRVRPMCETAMRREQLAEHIREAHEDNREVYGSPRIFRELLSRRIKCCVNTVAKIMRTIGLRSKIHRKFRPQTTNSNHRLPVAPNVLDRQFSQTQLNRGWASDITYIPTDEGYMYLAVVLDLCSRKVIGWSMREHQRADIVCEALEMAVRRRRLTRHDSSSRTAVPPPATADLRLLLHSDRGVQYASDQYQSLLCSHGFICSMSGQGDCWDNAVAESFFGTLKTECVHHERYRNHAEAKASIFEYIECFYNRKRLHSSLNYLSPDEYERRLRN